VCAPAGLKEDAGMRFAQANVFRKDQHGKMVQQAGTFQLAKLLIADTIGNDPQWLAGKSLQAGRSIVIRAGE